MPKNPTTKQKVKLSPVAEQLLGDELQLLLGTFLPAQAQQQGDVLRGLGPAGVRSTQAGQGLGRANEAAKTATRTAGTTFGLPGRVTAGAQRSLQDDDALLFGGLQNLLSGISTSQRSLVDPRFAQFLRPDVSTTTDPGSAQTVTAGVGTAVALAGLAAAL